MGKKKKIVSPKKKIPHIRWEKKVLDFANQKILFLSPNINKKPKFN